MRILVFNWRDIKNPVHGGAEIVTHEHLRRWALQGHTVDLISSSFPGAKPVEDMDGYTVHRVGNKFTVYWKAFRLYRQRFHGKVDLVVDEVNTVPFFTPLYVKGVPVMSFFHQLCRQIWFYEMPFPLSLVGYILEPLYLQVYRGLPAMVVSESTRHDLQRIGFSDVSIIPEGIDFKPINEVKLKEKDTVIYVGRLKKSKRVHHIISAMKKIVEKSPKARLLIVGDGDENYKRQLRLQVKNLGLTSNVIFFGRVSFETRNELMSRAKAIVVSSVKEGWGLIVTEAAAVGTPAIVYNVDGLRDAVVHMKTGIICKRNNPDELAFGILMIFRDNSLSRELSKNALSYSRNFDWERSAAQSLRIVELVSVFPSKAGKNSGAFSEADAK